MKHPLFFIFIAAFCLSFSSCKKKGVVSFCEGVDQDGKGVNCGSVFSTGDLTAVFNTKSSFDTDSLAVKVYNKNDGSRKSIFELTTKVNPDDTIGHFQLELYDEGVFRVVVEKHGELLSEGDIEVVEAPKK
jgi:hypothetical protein